MSDWGQGSKNNDIGWGQGAVNNDISWGSVHADSWAGDTDIVGGSSYDATYQAVLDYATTQGYTLPSDSQKLLQNQLVIDLKDSGVWSKLDTFANFATDGSSDFALIDWKRLTQYTAVNSPAFTTNQGFKGNGTSSHIDTNFNAFNNGVQYTQDNASRGLYMFLADGTAALDGKAVAGINNMARTSTSFQRINTTSGLNVSFSFDSVEGMKSIHRTSSTNVELFNDTTQASRTATSATLNDNSQLILRSGASYGAHTISMYFNGASLVTENTDFVTAFDTYLNSL
jgi:hypothetical protein